MVGGVHNLIGLHVHLCNFFHFLNKGYKRIIIASVAIDSCSLEVYCIIPAIVSHLIVLFSLNYFICVFVGAYA